MFYCNSCDREMQKISRNAHMKTQFHITNAEKIPFVDQRIQVSLNDIKNTETPTYEDTFRCSYCLTDDKTKFYSYNRTRCKECKYKMEREIKKKKLLNKDGC